MNRRRRISKWGTLPALLLLGACGRPAAPTVVEPVSNTSLQVTDILSACVSAYQRISTCRAVGTLQDLRGSAPRTARVSWDFERPDRCRFQIGDDLALVLGSEWWIYDARTGRSTRRASFTRTPITTASTLLAGRVPFLMPVLIESGAQAFGPAGRGGFHRWSIESVDWRHGHPCYVVALGAAREPSASILRVWIDQDSFLVRRWAISGVDGNEAEYPVLICDYEEIALNEPIPDRRFTLEPAGPISVSAERELSARPLP